VWVTKEPNLFFEEVFLKFTPHKLAGSPSFPIPIEGFVSYIEKRIFRRVEAEVPVDLEMGDRTLQTTSSNISCGGMFLLLDPSQVQEQKSLNLVIHLPNRTKPVKLTGDVLRRENDSRPGVAVQFQGLYNDNILEIEKFVKAKLN
jgi:c-di-GMP-binding flagellar brake protein YcgR